MQRSENAACSSLSIQELRSLQDLFLRRDCNHRTQAWTLLVILLNLV
jgi:hypothetical protein